MAKVRTWERRARAAAVEAEEVVGAAGIAIEPRAGTGWICGIVPINGCSWPGPGKPSPGAMKAVCAPAAARRGRGTVAAASDSSSDPGEGGSAPLSTAPIGRVRASGRTWRSAAGDAVEAGHGGPGAAAAGGVEAGQAGAAGGGVEAGGTGVGA